ncbi:MAG: hypothetical protein Q7S09_03005 [bacterium]|nr:hypothetical protein [bacterium]
MKKTFWFASFVFIVLIGVLGIGFLAQAEPQSVPYNGKTYYVVTSQDATMDSGNEVCVALGKTCVGYTALTSDVCMATHPGAAKKSDMNGSKAGFYCDGAPQGGVCGNEKNTCHICPNCNVNADCATQIGDLYREMYVECTPGDEVVEVVKPAGGTKNLWNVPGRWWGSFRSTVARAFDFFREKLARLTIKQEKHVTVKVQGPQGTVETDVPVDSYVCEFYQQNKKLVTCGALAAADHFCVTAMDSRFATAVLCQDNGLVVCAKPCKTNPQELKPQRCAFDGDRPRGNQAPPLDFCTETITVDTKTGPTKKAGQECAHGGECNTGYCLGQTSDQGIKYFCSCKQSTLDFTCGK